MEPAGWIMMGCSIGAVLTLVIYCLSKVLMDKGSED